MFVLHVIRYGHCKTNPCLAFEDKKTGCQYLSFGQYSALNGHLICGSSSPREENLYVFTNSVDVQCLHRAEASDDAETNQGFHQFQPFFNNN